VWVRSEHVRVNRCWRWNLNIGNRETGNMYYMYLFIQYIHQLLRQEAFDESVLENMIDTETISLLQFIFYPIETRQRLSITTHWTVDWDVATMAEVQRDTIQKFVVLVRPSSTKCCVSNLFDIVNSRINDLSVLLIY